MKRNFIAFLTAILSFTAFPGSIYAATDNYVSNVIKVGKETELTGNIAPTLVLEASNSHTSDFQFSLRFSGAEWIGAEAGSFANGISYESLTESWLMVSVNVTEFDAVNEDIIIPLTVKITDPGDIIVSVDGQNSSVSSGTYVFANYIDGEFTLKIEKQNDIAGVGCIEDITISDSTHMAMKKGDRIKLTLNDGFSFEPNDSLTIEASGKFENIVDFSIEENNHKTAYLKLAGTTDNTSGKIIIKGLKIAPTANAAIGSVKLTLTTPTNDKATIPIARYVQLEKGIAAPIKTDVSFDALDPYVVRPVISGTWQSGKQILIKIDNVVLGTDTILEDGRFAVSYPETLEKLSIGSHTVTAEEYLGPYTDSTYGHSTTLEILGEYKDKNLTFTVGKTNYTLGGISFPLEAPAPFIDQMGHTMLPLRAMANILGISDDKISWSPETKTVVIKKSDTEELTIVVGQTTLQRSNGEAITLESPAVIREGSVFLPMRQVLNAFEIYNKDILWNQAAKSVTVVRK